jgi:hypothetical protein
MDHFGQDLSAPDLVKNKRENRVELGSASVGIEWPSMDGSKYNIFEKDSYVGFLTIADG